ncbi:MAG: GYF domain-containing protein [Myxococcota bacterium]|nr:GYF domain-containing protein [Myxococcota bacterium]
MSKPTSPGSSQPFESVSEDELSSLVDDVLSSGKHAILPRGELEEGRTGEERLHARVIAEQMSQLASSLIGRSDEGAEPIERWYFEVRGSQLGPLTLQQARKLWNDGEIGPDSYCWHEGFSSWIVLSRVTQLAAALAPRLPPPPQVEPTPSAQEEQASHWTPHAAALAEELFSQRPPARVESPKAPEQHAGVYYVLSPPPPPPAAPPPRFSALTQSLVTGVVAGAVMALILLLAWGRLPFASATPPVAPVVQPPPAVQVAPVVTAAPAAVPEPVVTPAPTPVVEAPPPAVARPAKVAPKPAPSKPTPAPGEVEFEEEKPAPPRDPDEDPDLVEKAARDGFEEAFGVEEPDEEKAPVPEEKKPSVYVPPPAGAAGSPLPDTLGQSQILEVVLSHKGAVQSCVQAHRPPPSDGSKLVMRWTITPEGKVREVSALSPEALLQSELSRCLAKVISAWSFPKHGQQMDPVVLPFAY